MEELLATQTVHYTHRPTQPDTLGEHKFSTPIQQKAFFKLMGLQYRVVYKKGVANRAADALSRRPHNTEAMAISAVQPRWVESVIEGYQNDPKAQELLTELSITQTNDQGYSLHKGVIRHKGRVWLGTQHQAHQAVLLAFHHSALGGHSGILPTYQKIKKLFSWPGMKESVTKFVQSCTVSQQAKSEHVRYTGKLQPLPIPKEAWHTVGMDFIEGLPVSNKFDTILVVVDKLTKFGHFIPLKHPFTATTVAQAFFDTVYRLHGLPKVIITDRDKIFVSHFWQQLFRLADTTLNMSSSYHPQTDGQTERLNQCLETYLRCLVHATPKKWASWMTQPEYWYNTTPHSALGRSPFEVLYGRSPRHFGISNTTDTAVGELDTWLQERQTMTELTV
jgi:hypothetical protein